MTSRDFAYWLQGFFEISSTNEITPEQVNVIKNHLNLVFKHEIDPSFGLTPLQEKEAQAIHDGITVPKWGYRDETGGIMRC